MQVKSISECSKGEHSAILSTFIKLPIVTKIFVLSIFEWRLKTGFTVNVCMYVFQGEHFNDMLKTLYMLEPNKKYLCLG